MSKVVKTLNVLIDNAEKVKNYDFGYLNEKNEPVKKLTGSKMVKKSLTKSREIYTFDL